MLPLNAPLLDTLPFNVLPFDSPPLDTSQSIPGVISMLILFRSILEFRKAITTSI